MRKFSADYLFTGREMAAEGTVLITKDDGTVEAILPAADAGEGVEALPGLLTPGFVNCHCHLELSHMKGLLPEKTGMVDFLISVIRGRGTATAQGEEMSQILTAIAGAEESMLHNGIVAVGDICNTSLTLKQKVEGRLNYHNFIETMGFIEQTAPDRLEAAVKIFGEFAGAYSLPIAAISLVPHAPYSVSPRLFGLIANFPGNQLITIHNQESQAENLFCQTGQGDFLRLYQALGLDISFFSGSGQRSMAGYLPHFYHNQTLLLVHNVDTREEDLAWKGGPDLCFCLCPNANLYISGQLPDVDLLMRHGCRIVLGTDSLASNHQLDILEEMKTLQHHFPLVPTEILLRWATSNGAEVLQMDGILGAFDMGKQPGVVLVSGMEEGKFTKRSKAHRLI
ncbi:amidohydrolase family protein [Flavitalea sp. BT771]|uniref:amidohydrolase family protein n=1 Tax=Flavitalea sp. BT771 TaxID=3063329 RepID=UPI0026E2F784|nr:amidohydrolase family protein [Flavitalea sp. BT771]MDO6433784.1 amidohydrolase family protein [Flavitalea sp. BT771]MDV6222311.1 amidohydrolase family protein [Flavitalea sp. BT771]